MLDTRTPLNPNRTRRMEALPRGPRPAEARTARPAARPPARPVSVGNTALESAPERPQPRAASKPRMSRLGRSEMRLMGLATTCTAIVCGLLLLYLAAYAHVSQLGYDQAEARTLLRRNQLQNESLRAERDRLQSRRRVLQAALALGMTPRGATPISYVTAPRRVAAAERAAGDGRVAAGTVWDGGQGQNGDTTAGGDKQPSFGH